MCHILDTLTKVNGLDEVYAYCSMEEIKELLPEGVKFLKRPTRLDRDETLGEEIYDEFTKTIDADVYVLAHATSPFTKKETIENALRSITEGGHDSAFSCEEVRTFTWFTIEPVMVETSAFFMFRREVWTEHHQRIGFNPYFARVDKIEGVDIDWPDDFNLAEKIAEMEH